MGPMNNNIENFDYIKSKGSNISENYCFTGKVHSCHMTAHMQCVGLFLIQANRRKLLLIENHII